MICTAHIRLQLAGQLAPRTVRCERELGHPGVHRVIATDEKGRTFVQEFHSVNAAYPMMELIEEN